MLMRRFLLFSLWSLTVFALNGQNDSTWVRKVLDYYLGESPESKPRFLAYPTLAYAPETKWEFGVSSLYVFHSGRDTTARLS